MRTPILMLLNLGGLFLITQPGCIFSYGNSLNLLGVFCGLLSAIGTAAIVIMTRILNKSHFIAIEFTSSLVSLLVLYPFSLFVTLFFFSLF